MEVNGVPQEFKVSKETIQGTFKKKTSSYLIRKVINVKSQILITNKSFSSKIENF